MGCMLRVEQDFKIDIFAIDSNRVNLHSLCHGQSQITSEKECGLAARWPQGIFEANAYTGTVFEMRQ